MHRIAVLGDALSIYGFAALGFDTLPCESREEALAALKSCCDGSVGVLYVTEKIGALLEDEIRARRSEPIPAIILIPGLSGNTGAGRRGVEESVEKAVGTKI
ncbi:MAG: V-type ATP synthase subunit F [Clostridia bacterium]|nr:V-type ATP synthase subunit F [Clostridia bacterium]